MTFLVGASKETMEALMDRLFFGATIYQAALNFECVCLVPMWISDNCIRHAKMCVTLLFLLFFLTSRASVDGAIRGRIWVGCPYRVT